MCSRTEGLGLDMRWHTPGGSQLPETFRIRPFDFLGWPRCNVGRGLRHGSREPSLLRRLGPSGFDPLALS